MMQFDTVVHEKPIYEYFHGDVEAKGIASEQINKLVIIHFTNRCGSNYLSDTLSKATEYRNLSESLRARFVVNKSRRLGLTSFHDYFSNYLCATPSILKASTEQLALLVKWGYLVPQENQKVHNHLKIVTIDRTDVVAQAASFEKAIQTEAFASFHKPQLSEISRVPDIARMTKVIEGFGVAYSRFLALCSAIGREPIRVHYEDFVGDPHSTIKRICSELSLDIVKLPEASMYSRQADEVNQRYKDFFLSEMLRTLA